MFTISASKLRSYISCPKKYDFVYNEEIEPIEKAEALETGGNYHEKIANFLKSGELEESEEKTKVDVMVKVFSEIIYPQIISRYSIKDVEVYKEMMLDENIKVIGYLDAITEQGIPIEHKTTSKSVDELYVYRLNWDNQVPIYMSLCNVNKCIYTVIQKPTIRQKQNETEEEFYDRCYEWYKTDTNKKVGIFEVVRTDEELDKKLQEIIYICEEIQDKKVFYRNPNECSIMGCPYSNICLDHNKNVMPIGFKKRENERGNFND